MTSPTSTSLGSSEKVKASEALITLNDARSLEQNDTLLIMHKKWDVPSGKFLKLRTYGTVESVNSGYVVLNDLMNGNERTVIQMFDIMGFTLYEFKANCFNSL